MKIGKLTAHTLLATAMLAGVCLASGARNVNVRYDAAIAGSQLASGQYDVQVQAHEATATVSFLKGKKVVATVQGKVIDRGERYAADQVVYSKTPSGHAVQEIRFKGSSEVVVFE